MIELLQFRWSPFCLVQQRILEYSGVPFRLVDIPSTDRTVVWKITRHRYYHVPVLRDGRTVVFETAEDSQVIAKYLDDKLKLGLFPAHLTGLQDLLWPHIESQIEEMTFKLNDVYYEEFVPQHERLNYLRHKERRFGRGCLERWRQERAFLCQELTRRLLPFEQMLVQRPFLLEDRPRFVDFDLYGMLANLLYTPHNRLPAVHPRLRRWFQRLSTARGAEPDGR